MLEWQVRSTRFTMFLHPEAKVAANLWQELTGQEPENSVVQKTLGLRQESGPFGDGKLTATVHAMRVDLVHDPADISPAATLGRFPEAASATISLVKRWVESGAMPASERLALGVILRAPVPDLRTGYNELRKYVSAVPQADDATDFLYQVNRPRAAGSGVQGLRINRLAKWSVSAWQTVMVAGGSQMVGGPREFACNLELDINTAPESAGEFTVQQVPRILDDLLLGAGEVAEHGERL